MPHAHKHNHADDAVHRILNRCGLFGPLSTTACDALAQRATIQKFAKGKTLFFQEEVAHTVVLLLSGWVKLYRETLDGTEAIIDILTSGHLVGESALFNGDRHTVGAEVIEAAEGLVIPVASFHQAMEKDPSLAMGMLTMMTRYRRQHELEIEHRTLQNAPQRIACFLLRLCPIDVTGALTLNLPYDKTLLAARLGMQPETFSRALGKLKEDIGISVRGAALDIPSTQSLVEYACGACSASYPCQDLLAKSANSCGGCGNCSSKK